MHPYIFFLQDVLIKRCLRRAGRLAVQPLGEDHHSERDMYPHPHHRECRALSKKRGSVLRSAEKNRHTAHVQQE